MYQYLPVLPDLAAALLPPYILRGPFELAADDAASFLYALYSLMVEAILGVIIAC